MNHWCCCGALFVSLLVGVPSSVAQTQPRYVLVLSSFEQRFSPHSVFAGVFRTELASRSTEPIQFIDASLPSASNNPDMHPEAVLDYLKTTFAVHQPDLIVSVGGVAALFAQKHRQQLFPETPMLFASVDQRFVQQGSLTANEAAVAVSIDARLLVENILQVLPFTTTIAVVLGSSQIEEAWHQALTRAFEPFKDRLNFLWFNKLSFQDMLKRSTSLPPHSAILFAHLAIDAHGVPQAEEYALPQLHAVANAPVFGVYNSQLGRGVVGGPVLALDELGRNAANVALRMLQGESPRTLTPPPQLLSVPTFDAAELERWYIRESQLPRGSVVLFRQPSVWRRYTTEIVAAIAVALVETTLVVALLTLSVKRRRAERLMHESEERFRVLANTAPVMIWMADADGKRSDFNRAWLEFTGRSIQEELADGWIAGVDSDDLGAYLYTYSTAFERREPFRIEYRLRRSDGEYRWILDAGVPRRTADGSFVGYTGSAIDVTDHKRAKAALSNLSQKLMQAQEKERTLIARELHDDVCQRVAGLTIQLDTLVQRLPGGDAALRDPLADLRRQCEELGADIQALSHRLHSSKLELLGLPRAATAFCRELSEQHGVTIDFKHEGVLQQLPEETKLGLFRVMQEALMNAVKHSGVRQFEVTLRGTADAIYLDVIDHGVGFNPEHAVRGEGLGLVSMRERLSLLGGEVVVQSRPREGTIVHVRVPSAAAHGAYSSPHGEFDSNPPRGTRPSADSGRR